MVIDGLISNITYVLMMGPNKQSNLKKILYFLSSLFVRGEKLSFQTLQY